MVTQIKDMDAPSQKALGQRLYEKNVALGNKIRKSVHGKVPTDPNVWQQMRENFEAIVLGDPSFSSKHNIEEALWKLHYKRIDEYRARIRRAALPTKSDAKSDATDVNDPVPATHVTKIHLQFKAFLSEASGFYHDLIVKLRDKYGFPVSCFSEELFRQSSAEKDAKRYVEMKNGLVSWHRCLICLGDLARYKISHEEDESGTRDYAVASGYYLQASSIWPSSGHPHHQLAIVASYSGDELMAVYWYFRSLAVEIPISTTRESLVVLFEKNRHNYLQLLDIRSSSAVKGSKLKVRGKVEARRPSKDKTKTDSDMLKRTEENEVELFKSFCTRFVRLNGIIFTRLSLETFAEVLGKVSASFKMLLSHGPEEKLNFGKDEDGNRLLIVRLVAILIFTVHNINNAGRNQSHMQRQVFLQNACTAVFQLVGTIIRRCTEIRDICSSYLLPGILVFVEWLASCPDVASGMDADEVEANVRLVFWNHYVKFLNKLLSSGVLSVDAAENAFIHGASTHEEGSIKMHLSLWEDFELRGYLPLLQSQMNIEYSRKHAFGEDELKERKARVERVLAASKELAAVVRIKEKELCFDPEAKIFMIGTPSLENKSYSEGNKNEKDTSSRPLQSLKASDDEEEDEVIVFKPNPLRLDATVKPSSFPQSVALNECYVPFTSDNCYQQDLSKQNGDPPAPILNTTPQHAQPVQLNASSWSEKQQASTIDDIIHLRFLEDEPLDQSGRREDDNTFLLPIPHMLNQQFVHTTETEFPYSIEKLLNTCSSTAYSGEEDDSFTTPLIESLLIDDDDTRPLPTPQMLNQQSIHPRASEFPYSPEKLSNTKSTTMGSGYPLAYSASVDDSLATPLLESLKMNPVVRPSRHHGPPPGFSIHPKKLVGDTKCSEDATGNNGVLYSDRLRESHSIGLNARPQVFWRDQSDQGQHLRQEQQVSQSNCSFAPMLQLHQVKSGLNDWYPF
ncbi:unnamed protein product [Rhodiola kirilowii]